MPANETDQTELPDVPPNFRHRLSVATFGLLLVVLVIHLLQLFQSILLPLLIAGMIGYAILPAHRWLVRRGIRSSLAYIVLVGALLACFIGLGQVVYSSINSIDAARIGEWHGRLENLEDRWVRLLGSLGITTEFRFRKLLEDVSVSQDDVFRGVRSVAGMAFSVLTFSLVVFIYLIFMLAEKLTFPHRMALAFGDIRATEVLVLVKSINEAIVDYIAVKTWISFVTALLSFLIFVLLDIQFAFFWGVLIFVLNFVPYLGGIVAMAPPVLLAFVQFDSIWRVPVVVSFLVGIQFFTGQFVEPRMAGNRLNLSPLLILLSLAFWGFLWGVGGMLVAVPLTVVIKIILDHIPETRPIATLMSNV